MSTSRALSTISSWLSLDQDGSDYGVYQQRYDAAGATEADAEAVLAAGWPEEALFDAVAICALYNLMNRLVNGLGIEADADYFEAAAKRLSTGGYAAMAEALPQG